MTVREAVMTFIKKEYGVEAECPWAQYPEYEVFRHEDNKKWFAIIMPVEKKHLGMSGDGYVDIMNVKLDSMLIDMLRQQEGFLPAYHMNKTNWISIRLDGSVEPEQIYHLIDQSYTATASRKTKKKLKREMERSFGNPENNKDGDDSRG